MSYVHEILRLSFQYFMISYYIAHYDFHMIFSATFNMEMLTAMKIF